MPAVDSAASTRWLLATIALTVYGSNAQPAAKPPSGVEELGSAYTAQTRASTTGGGGMSSFAIVSSMPLRMVITPEPQRLVATCLALSLPLIVVHDGTDGSLPSPLQIPDGVHTVNVFDVVPTMHLLTSDGSPIDAFYAARGTAEPFEKNLMRHGIASGKLLVRKVGAMAYALALAMHGSAGIPSGARVVLWADADVQFLKRPDDAFLHFALQHDVSYIPFVKKEDLVQKAVRRELLHDGWRLDSGLMAFRVGANSLGFISAALDLYEGGLLRLWRRCKRRTGERACPTWLTRNLYMNDVYVWALLLHASAHTASGGDLPHFVASELQAFNASSLSQGWFAYDGSRQRFKLITFASPAATPFTSPFELRDYICHHILSGPYSKMRMQARNARTPRHVADPSLRLRGDNANERTASANADAAASKRAATERQSKQHAAQTALVARACVEHGGGLSISQCAALRHFTRALVGHNECYSEQASDTLRREVSTHFSSDERWRWQSLPSSTHPEAARSHGARWLTLSAGVPCNTSAWIPQHGDMYARAQWSAAPEWAHANNKGPSLALCPGELLRMDTSPCTSKMHALRSNRRRRCHDDALPLCEPLLFGFGARAHPHRPAGEAPSPPAAATRRSSWLSRLLPGWGASKASGAANLDGAAAAVSTNRTSGCLAYSFGIGGEWSFEDWMAKRCEVHAFDPTTPLRARHEAHALERGPNLTFHYEGLGLRTGGSASTLVSGVYGKLGGAIRPLDELLRAHGHAQRYLDFLKIDCEGCEWEAFGDIAERSPWVLKHVCTLVMEVHVSTQLQVATTQQLARMAAFWKRYVEEAGFRLWYIHRDPGSPRGIDNHVHPLLVALGMDERVCCFEIGLHRPQCGRERQLVG